MTLIWLNKRRKDGISISERLPCDGLKTASSMACTVYTSFPTYLRPVHPEHNLNELTKMVSELEFQLDQWYSSQLHSLTTGTPQSPNP